MRTISLSDDDYKKVQDFLNKAQKVKEPAKKRTTIYKTDGSVLLESDKETIKEAVVKHKADLRGADLRWTDLRGADLRGANLRWTDLRGADLRGANLRWADLRWADLHEVELHKAKFYGKNGTTKIKRLQTDDFFKALGIVVED